MFPTQGDTRLQQLAKTDRNPVQETEYQNLVKSQGAAPSSPTGFNNSIGDPIRMAQQVRQFTIESNKPQVQALQSSSDTLKTRYDEVLNSIKGQQKTAEDYRIRSTSSALGARGLLPQSSEGQAEIAAGLEPLTAQYQGLTAQTGLAREQDLLNIAQQIAALQSGDPTSAFSGALNIMGQQQQAQQATAQQAEQSRQFNLQQELAKQQYDTNAAYAAQTRPLELALLQAQVNKANQPAVTPFNFNRLTEPKPNNVPSSFQPITSQTQSERESRARSRQLYG